MRLHSLDITAFGPFAETARVDFDELSEAGLFLLSGATGAGKTSVLDAVCFALYGDVPGDRSSAKRLRCDQADPGVAPRVRLEATLSGRRFRIERSPAWERPKKRGSGTTAQQASVTLSEQVDGAWTPLSSRLDETGHLVSRLVGMNLTQFTQVAMLPQGRFQAFLRARSEERHQLLQRLFHTGRFEDVEQWLRDRRTALRRGSEAAAQGVAALAHRVSEVTGATPPSLEATEAGEAGEAGDVDAVLPWAESLRDEAAVFHRSAQRVADQTTAAEATARASLEEARRTLDLRARTDAARAEIVRLRAAAPEADRARAQVAAAHRAAAVVPVLRQHERAEAERARTVEVAAGVDRSRPELEAARTTAAEAVVRVRDALPLQQQVRDLTTQTTRLGERADRLDRQVLGAETRLRAVGLRDRLAVLEVRAAALARAEALAALIEVAREARSTARAATLTAREHALDVRQARLDGMAAEIAGALAVGACCPVCGSADHPAKARAGSMAPDDVAERAAQRGVDDASALEHLRDTELRDLVTQREHAVAAAGDEPPADLRHAVGEARRELAATIGDEPCPRDDQAAVAEELRSLSSEAADARATLAARRSELDQAQGLLARLLDGSDGASLEALLALHQQAERSARHGLEALTARDRAVEAALGAAAELEEALLAAGFTTAAEVRAAAREERELAGLAARLADHDRRTAAAEAVLAEPGADAVARLEADDLPDVASLTSDHDAALTRLGEARASLARWSGTAERLEALVHDLARSLDRWAPLRADLRLTADLSSFVEGKSPDNRLQMRLSAYVLAYRLTQVVDAANERLARMSDQRYALEHVGRRGAGETRGGLSLLVRDDWSGESRDPATLSGGETFVVSLALALGLADVITSEVGGAALDTLFVDEGFGSLDADTLDDVMDTLDSLRDGGRVVGVVSHVAEMRDRIPTQLVVTKARRGSTLAIRR